MRAMSRRNEEFEGRKRAFIRRVGRAFYPVSLAVRSALLSACLPLSRCQRGKVAQMGGGGLNILPKKSWNVWNHDNIEKVRRDEAQHAAEQEALQRQQRQVDTEWRVEELQRRKKRTSETAESAGADDRHVNFFEVEERQHAERGANEHHERERKLKEEREARRSFRCLGESADHRGDKQAAPWYVTGNYGLPTAADAVPTAAEAPAARALEPAAEAAGQRRVDDGADPLKNMQRLVEKKRKHTEGKERASKRGRLDALRQERVAREQAERQRAMELMRAKHPGLFAKAPGPAGGSATARPSDSGRGQRQRRWEEEDDGTTRESAAVRQHRERMAQRRQERYRDHGGNHSGTAGSAGRHHDDRRRHSGY